MDRRDACPTPFGRPASFDRRHKGVRGKNSHRLLDKIPILCYKHRLSHQDSPTAEPADIQLSDISISPLGALGVLAVQKSEIFNQCGLNANPHRDSRQPTAHH
ncbi:MAG: hypothetical protein KME26_05890 [Oscillatoria princeps RMCB-10]|nr:hypothetical protein [Oscillatoria princeps RMCB-10]